MKRFFCLVIAAFVAPAAVWPQASNSTVRGSVRDQVQAAIPTAVVTLLNTATNVTRETSTNEAGLYVFPGVIPGQYRIKAQSAGLQPFEGALTVQTQQDATVEIVLQIGQTTTEVEVKDVTPLVTTDSPALGHVLERLRIEQLPGQGRGYQNLLQTVPGISWSTHGHGIGGRMRGNGMRIMSSIVVFDGGPMTEAYEGWDFARTPDLDAIQELHIEVNNSSAKFSRPNTIVMSSRSGSNEFHGALFHTNRNSAYGVARRRQDTFTKAPYLNRNEYGLSTGAPIHIPRLYNGRNRTFWFFAWEGTRYVSYSTQQLAVPTEAMRNGDFRGLVDVQGRQYTLYDPFTTNGAAWQRQPLAYRGVPNTIDPARLSPTAKFIFGVTKLPTHPQINPLVDSNWIGLARRPLEQDSYSVRIDHRISDKDVIYGRYAWNTHYEELQNGYASFEKIGGIDVIGRLNRWWPNYNLSLTWMHTFSPSLTNELLVTGTRDWRWQGAGDRKTDYAALQGLPNPFNAVNWPVTVGMQLGTYSLVGDPPYYTIVNYLTIQDNATKVYGKHEFQFGLQYRFDEVPRSIVSESGRFNVDTLATSLYDTASTAVNPIARPLTGHGIANLYLGVMDYNAQFRRPWVYMRRWEMAPYIQDNWKVSPRLTLNLGLRYEVRTPIGDRNNSLIGFDIDKRAYLVGTDLDRFIRMGATTPSILNALRSYGGNILTNTEVGMPSRLGHISWKNFGPRLGFAYRALSGRNAFVVRGGYRVSYYAERMTNWFRSQDTPALISASFQNSVTNTALSPDGLPNYGLRSVPKYVAGVNTPSSIIDVNDTRLLTRGSFVGIRNDPHLKDPKVHDWNLTVEKEVMADTVARVAYVGNHTVDIPQLGNLNDATPAYIWYASQKKSLPTGPFANVATRPYDQQVYGDVGLWQNGGFAWYNGVQLELERRFRSGFGYQVFYVVGNVLAANGVIADSERPYGIVQGSNNFLSGAVPTEVNVRNRFLNYQREITAPKHQVRWNFIADLPFGQGKLLGGNVNRVVEKLIGGWQIASTGSLNTSYWTLPTTIYPTSGQNIEIFGYQYPVEDCRSGACFPGYLWWNGYIPANRINSIDAQGRPNGVMGVPANYKPAAQPLIPWGSTALPPNAPAGTNLQSLWDTNTVWIPLNDGMVQRTIFNDNLHPWRNQYVGGPRQWFMDASLFKFIKLGEKVTLRFNIDIFNVFNNPNNPVPTTMNDGLLSTRNSGSAARVAQLSLRLTW